jgi:cell division protein FtsL
VTARLARRRNAPVGALAAPRQTGRSRSRDLWRLALVSLMLAGLLVFSAWQHFELLRHGYRLEQLQQQRAEEEEINRHLRLEVEALTAPQRIERLAVERLGLRRPTADETVVVQRVRPPAPPPRSVIAAHRR